MRSTSSPCNGGQDTREEALITQAREEERCGTSKMAAAPLPPPAGLRATRSLRRYTSPAVKTHFCWPALPTDVREVFRVLWPRAKLILIAEVCKGSAAFTAKAVQSMALLRVEDHRELFASTGYSDVEIVTELGK